MNYLSLNELIEKRKEEIMNNTNYSKHFYDELCRNWKQLIDFLKERNLVYNEESKKQYLEFQTDKKSRQQYLYSVHCIDAIEGLEYLKLNQKCSRVVNNRYEIVISDYNQDILNKYKLEISEYNSKKTTSEKIKLTKDIMRFFENEGISDYSKLNSTIIRKYIEYYMELKYSKKKRYNWALKMFLVFLYDNNYTETNFSYLLDKIKPQKTQTISTVWTQEELQKIINNLKCNTPIKKRNKAIVLIAIRLGIRFSDIKNLEFSNIDWKENTLTFVQEKTKVEIKLPLLEDVGLAIIDYIKNGRPKTNSKNIFVTHDEYATKLSHSSNINEYLMETYESAGIDYLSKERLGIHTFRHTLASNMLKAGIPQQIISSTLCHVNSESDKTYLKIDIDSLKTCCLEVINE